MSNIFHIDISFQLIWCYWNWSYKFLYLFNKFHQLTCFTNWWLQKEYSEQWALACGEILRILTHYNRPIYKVEHHNSETERSNSGNHATTSKPVKQDGHVQILQEHDRKPLRPLSPWITDILLASPLGIRSDYFRWCIMNFSFSQNSVYSPVIC